MWSGHWWQGAIVLRSATAGKVKIVITDLFRDLYRKAFLRDHPRLVMLGMLHDSLGMSGSPSTRVRLAEQLLDLDDDIEQRLLAVARRERIRIRRDVRFMCPECGNSSCPRAVRVIHMASAKGLLSYLLSGGQSPEYEE